MKITIVLAGALLVLGLSTVLQPVGAQYWCWDADNIYAQVVGSTVTFYHDAALYNCCPDRFDFEIDIAGGELIVEEYEILSSPCYCICCYNVALEIEDVPPGDYTGVYHWYDYEIEEWRVWLLEILVPDVGQSGEPQISWVSTPECLESSSVPEQEPSGEDPDSGTWGRLKTIYR